MNDDYCLWMGDIDPRMDESIIKDLFHIYNVHPVGIKLIKDKETNTNKNYCFIYFKNIFEANRILNQLRGKPIPNTQLTFKLNWANYLTSTAKTIYVGNLNPIVNDTSLMKFFKSKYKSTSKAKVIVENGQSKKYGFVTFKKENDYRRSLIEMNGVFFEGTNIKIKEYKQKNEDNSVKEIKNIKDNNNNDQRNLKNNNTNNKLEFNNGSSNYINNNEKIINANDLNSDKFLVSNLINRLSWVSNASPINSVNIGINRISNIIVNSNVNWFNRITSRENYDEKNNYINFNSNLNSNKKYKNIINNDISNINNINNINNDNKNYNIIDNTTKNKTNKCKVNKNKKLETLEDFDEVEIKKKINESLKKMMEYYKERMLINGNKIKRKLILYLILIYPYSI